MTLSFGLSARSAIGLTVCVLVAAQPTPSHAADLDGPRPRPIPVEEWSPRGRASIWQGFYFGLSGGYGFGDSTQSYDRNDNHGLAITEPSGFVGSVTAGYNWRPSGGLVAGIEGDLGLMDVSADDKIVYDGHVYRTHLGPLWGTVRARLGLLLTERMLVYATGGGAFMQVDEVSIGNTPGETASNADFRAGWVVGAGAEYAFSDTASLKAEYLYMDFGRYEGFSANREGFYFENQVQVVRAGLNFKF